LTAKSTPSSLGETAYAWAPVAAMTVAWVAMLGSLYYSEIRGFVPCPLCWYQRILMYPLALITLVGVIRGDKGLAAYVLPFSILGIGLSGYHYLIQLGVFGQSNACAVGIPCNLRYVNVWGFITIPFQALTAFVLITGLMMIGRETGDGERETG
jgi:disulfide bond formation protein DsbB